MGVTGTFFDAFPLSPAWRRGGETGRRGGETGEDVIREFIVLRGSGKTGEVGSVGASFKASAMVEMGDETSGFAVSATEDVSGEQATHAGSAATTETFLE